MFTPELRDDIRRDLLATATHDQRISGGAITGSAATGLEDAWSDIDLAFAIAEGGDLASVLADWTTRMHSVHSAIDHVDVMAGPWVYRVFLLPNTLQVDLAFTPASEFRALAPTFKLVFGNANAPRHTPLRSAADLIGWGWLYALHARSCIARNKLWQAEFMISGMRDTALSLACAHWSSQDLVETSSPRFLGHFELFRAHAA